MRKTILALAILGAAGAFAVPASADCISDMAQAQEIVNNMPEGRAKQAALRELKLAQEAAAAGDEKMCLVHVGVCAQYTSR